MMGTAERAAPGESAKSRLTTSARLVIGIDGKRRRVADASKACGRVSMTMAPWICRAMLGFINLITTAPKRMPASGT
jgi:hypothetical protein